MKKIFLLMISFLLSLSLASCKTVKIDGSFSFKYFSGGSDYTTSMYYSDDYFNQPSTTYNPELATASLSFAMASFASADEEYVYKSQNGIDLLEKLGFLHFHVNEDYQIKPHADSFGVFCAGKPIDDYMLIAIGTRGANYENEWASNFTLTGKNKENYAQGFYDASEIYLETLREFLDFCGFEGKIKIWTSGYSRAAATTNIAAGRIDIAIKENKVSELLDANVTLKKEDLYAYCFEAPQGVRYEDDLSYIKGEDFNNIFCVINYNDPVPKVAMSFFRYSRYGVDIVLSDAITDINYEENLKTITKLYDSYQNSSKLGEYKIANFNMEHKNKYIRFFTSYSFNYWPQGLFLDDFLSFLSAFGIENLDYYEKYLQQGLRDTFITLYKNDGVVNSLVDLGITVAREIILRNDASIVMDDLMHNRSRLADDLAPLLAAALKSAKVDADATSIISAIKSFLASLGRSLDFDLTQIVPLLSKDNIMAIGSAHYPELCLAHLRAMDKNYVENPISVPLDGKYYSINCYDRYANLKVTCNGKTIAEFNNGEVIKYNNSIAYGRKGNALLLRLPLNAKYEFTSSSSNIAVLSYNPNEGGYTEYETDFKEKDNIYTFTL